MFVTRATINAAQGSGLARAGIRTIELLLMAGATLLLLGLLHGVRAGRAESFSNAERQLERGEVIDLNEPPDGPKLAVALTPFFPSPDEARQAADALRQSRQKFPRVGALAGIRRADGRSWFPSYRIAELKPYFVVRRPAEWNAAFTAAVWTLLLSFWGYALLASLLRSQANQVIVPIAAVCSGVGIAVQATCMDPLRDTLTLTSMAGALPVCAAILLCGSKVSVERWCANWMKGFMAAALASAVLLLVLGGSPAHGVHINLWGLQPGEFIRLLTVAAIASGLAKSWLAMRHAPVYLPLGLRLPRLEDGVAYFGVLVSLLFLACRDQGPAAITALVTLALYSVAAGSGRVAIAALAGALTLAVAGPLLFPGFFATAMGRFTMLVHPWDNRVRGGGHLAEMLYTFASGGWTGQGMGAGFSHLLVEAHTDGVLPAWTEQSGWVGLMVFFTFMTALIVCGFRISRRAVSEFGYFLSFGLTALLATQTIVIAAGTLGVMPLTGVTTPFLSYGGSSQLAVFLMLAALLSVSSRPAAADENVEFVRPERVVQGILAAVLAVCVMKAGTVAWSAVTISGKEGITRSWLRDAPAPVKNPRLLAMAKLVPRGSLLGADGLIFATSRWSELQALEPRYRALGIDVRALKPSGGRYYPAGPYAFHAIGDAGLAYSRLRADTQAEWMFDQRLRGYRGDDLIYLLQRRRHTKDPRVKELLEGNRSLGLTLSFAAQYRAAKKVESEMKKGHGAKQAALIAMDAQTGELKVVISYPFPEPGKAADPDVVRDLARNGQFPPGSTGKLVTLETAGRHQSETLNQTFVCRRLPDGRVGNYLEAARLLVRDDSSDHHPHGNTVNWRDGLRVSCNATYGGIAERLRQDDMRETAALFTIHLRTMTPAEQVMVGYGQGPIMVSPQQMMQVAAVAANGGRLVLPHLVVGNPAAAPVQVVSPEFAREMAAAMRSVVLTGTAASLRHDPLQFIGKTGTAQWRKKGGEEHAWFVGATGYGTAQRKLSFAVLVPRGGHGAHAAVPLAAKVLPLVAQ